MAGEIEVFMVSSHLGWMGCLLFFVGGVEWVVGMGVDVVGHFFDHLLHGDGFIFWWNLWNIRGF